MANKNHCEMSSLRMKGETRLLFKSHMYEKKKIIQENNYPECIFIGKVKAHV